MATYNEISTGGAVGGGCSLVNHLLNFENPFEVGDIVYSKRAAEIGKLEKLCIKKIIMELAGTIAFARYVDTLNGLYFENELLTYNAALVIARNYHRQNIIKLKAKLDELCS